MKIFLVRHAKAMKRSRWTSPDAERPLTQVGVGQAHALADRLASEGIRRVISSPYARCRATVAPLAATLGIALETNERLAEGEDAAKALDLLRSIGDEPVALCSHGDVIPELLCELEERGLHLRDELRCEKGSIWLIEGKRWPKASARYLASPARGRAARRRAELAAEEDEEESDADETRLAVLDLGSTSFNLLVVEATRRGRLLRVLRERTMLRLGAAIAQDGRVPEDIAARAAQTARELRKVAVHARAERLLPVATAALRDAHNGPALAAAIGRAIDVPVRILSGAEEARLMFHAFARRVGMAPGLSLGIDLGGGSLELAVGDREGVRWETTLPLGVARLTGELATSDPLTPEAVRAVRERVGSVLTPQRKTLAAFGTNACIATGGTANALARLVTARRGLRPTLSVNELFLPASDLAKIERSLRSSTIAERLEMPGVRRRRADLLPTGALVLTTLCDVLGLDGFTVSDWGLREGVILEHLGLIPQTVAREEPDA